MTAQDESYVITLLYSIDNGSTWSSFATTTDGTTIATLNNGNKLLLKGSVDRTFGNTISSSKEFKVSGDLTTLTNGNVNTSGFTGYLLHLK